MPTYEYACKECAERLEVHQSFNDAALTECPSCGGPLRKVFGNIAITFKGSGFYKTDSRSTPKADTKPTDGAKTDSSSSSSSDSSSGSSPDSSSSASSSSDSTAKPAEKAKATEKKPEKATPTKAAS